MEETLLGVVGVYSLIITALAGLFFRQRQGNNKKPGNPNGLASAAQMSVLAQALRDLGEAQRLHNEAVLGRLGEANTHLEVIRSLLERRG